jgi:hypothetical protein
VSPLQIWQCYVLDSHVFFYKYGVLPLCKRYCHEVRVIGVIYFIDGFENYPVDD